MILMKWLTDRKEICTWIAAGAGMFLLSLLATFPFGALQARLLSELNRATGIDARITDWSVAWPLGVEWRHVTLSRPDWIPVQLAFLQAKLGLFKAVGGNLNLDLVVRLDESSSTTGLAKATLSASSFLWEDPISFAGQLQHIDLSQILHQYVGHGILNGTFSHRIESRPSSDGTIKGEGTWTAEAKDVTIDRIPLGNGRTLSLDFANVSAGLACRDAVCDVTELKGEGPDGSFTGEGTITMQQPIQNSRLALNITIVPGSGFASKAAGLGLPSFPIGSPIALKIVGPLAQARIAL